MKGTSVSPCASAGNAHSGMPKALSPATANPPLRMPRLVFCIVMIRSPASSFALMFCHWGTWTQLHRTNRGSVQRNG